MEGQHLSASENLTRARQEAREFGDERRAEIKKRVQEQRELEERGCDQDSGSRAR